MEIRVRRANGAMQKILAVDYGVSEAYISSIVNGLTGAMSAARSAGPARGLLGERRRDHDGDRNHHRREFGRGPSPPVHSGRQPVARFRIASTPRHFDKAANEWKDGDSLFLTCNVWRQAAENVAESLQRGMRVIVSGRLRQRSHETKEGEKRTVYEVEVDDVGPSLRNASAKVTRAQRSTAAQESQRASGNPWTAADPGGFSDEPPF